MSYGPGGDGSAGRQPCYKSRESVWLLHLQAWPPRRGWTLAADQSGRKLSALPLLNYPLGSQSQGPENASSICSLRDMILRHARPCTRGLVPEGQSHPSISPAAPCARLRFFASVGTQSCPAEGQPGEFSLRNGMGKPAGLPSRCCVAPGDSVL